MFWGCTYTFFLQIRPENYFFHRPGGAGAPTVPPLATPITVVIAGPGHWQSKFGSSPVMV